MLYSLKQKVFDLDKQTKHRKSHYLTVAKGLTWQEAKAARNLNRSLSIVPERAYVAAGPAPLAADVPAQLAEQAA